VRPWLRPPNEKARAPSLADGSAIYGRPMNLRTNPPPIPFIDVAAQRRRLGAAIDEAVIRVLNHCQFILGPEVRTFESDLAAFAAPVMLSPVRAGQMRSCLRCVPWVLVQAMRYCVHRSRFARRRKWWPWSVRLL